MLRVLLVEVDKCSHSVKEEAVGAFVVAIVSLATVFPEWAYRFVFEHVLQLEEVSESHMLLLSKLCSSMETGDRHLGHVLDTETASNLVEHMLSTLHETTSPSSDLSSTEPSRGGEGKKGGSRSALQAQAISVISELAYVAGDAVAESIVGRIFQVLEHTSDREFHDACTVHLRHVVAKLSPDHKLVKYMESMIEKDIVSSEPGTRLRVLTTTSLLHDVLSEKQRSVVFLLIFLICLFVSFFFFFFFFFFF